jgi:nicotinamidase-related amidase
MGKQRTALLVIDMQLGPIWGTYKQQETCSVIQSIIQKAEKQCIPIFYIQHEGMPGSMMEKGSQFWQFAEGIRPRPEDIIIHKQATDAFYKTELKEELGKRGVTHLVVTGVRTEYCVDTTCRIATTLGYDVTLVEDGHTCVDGVIPAEAIIKHHNYNLSTVGTREKQIMVTSSNQIVF